MNDASAGAALATTSTSLLLAVQGDPYIYELDPDTGDVIRMIANPAGANVQAMAYSNGRITLQTHSQAQPLTPLNEMFMFKTAIGSTKYHDLLEEGLYIVKLSDTPFQQARAQGWLNDSDGARNFPRGGCVGDGVYLRRTGGGNGTGRLGGVR